MTLPEPHLLTAEHDLDGLAPGAQPARSILVCSAVSAASDPLPGLLRRCGAGIPLEYFHPAAVAPLSRRWRAIHVDEYITALHHHRSSDTGVFGLVLRWRQVRRLHGRVAGIKPMTAERLLSLVTTIAPQPTFVFVRSAERDHAAVRRYVSEHDGADVTYDPRAIAQSYTLLEATERAWLQWFEMADIRPLEVRVRASASEPTAKQIVEALGLAPPTGAEVEPAAPRAMPAVEHDLLLRFRADAAAPAPMPDDALVPESARQ